MYDFINRKEKGEYMYPKSLYPFGKLNTKVVFMIQMLLIPMFTVISMATTIPATQIDSSIAKLSPILLEKIGTLGNARVDVLVETTGTDYSDIISTIDALGGTVRHQFKYVDALSVMVPTSKIVQLASNNDIVKMYLDVERSLASSPGQSLMPPRGFGDLDSLIAEHAMLATEGYDVTSVTPEELIALDPANYWNPWGMGAATSHVWEKTNYGMGSIVVIIDTGIWTSHWMFWETDIIGGVDLSLDVGNITYEGWDNPNNHYHGAHVAGIVASTGGIIVQPDDLLALSIELHLGMTLPTVPSGPYAGWKNIWLLGMAPASSLYIVKVFDHTGGAIPEWLVLAGIEHAIDLKLVEGIDVDIISMSIGGPNLYDGREVADKLVDYATSLGITIVAAAGNEGPASMTVSSPGSAYTAITVGAAANPVNTRVYWDYMYYYLGIGYYLFTSDDPQIYASSSRGPTSGGRIKPTISATGMVVLSAYIPAGPFGLAFRSGTSMATPAVSGGIALLNAFSEMHDLGASPEDHRQAIASTAIWLEGYTEYDQGAGYLYVEDALRELELDTSYGDVAPPLPKKARLMDITNIRIVGKGTYEASIENLAPGLKKECIFKITEATDSIRLDVTNVWLNPDENLGLNSFEVYIQSAKRTTYGYYIESANVWGEASFYITDDETAWSGAVTGVYRHEGTRVIEPGYMKIVIENDWTSYGVISCDIKITLTVAKAPRPDVTTKGRLAQGEWTGWMKVDVPPGTEKAIIELWWANDWTKYPTTDMDMVIFWDMGYNTAGTTMSSPERVVLENPTVLYLYVEAYQIYANTERFEVRIFLT